MVLYTYTKQVNSIRLMSEISNAGLVNISHVDTVGTSVMIYFSSGLSSGEKSSLDGLVQAHVLKNTDEVVTEIIDGAIAFGTSIIKEFVKQNVLLGITQRGLTGHVRKALREVKDAVDTGSLYDAVTEIKNLNPADFDPVILTPARLLGFRNKLEQYLGVPLATSWDQDETWL